MVLLRGKAELFSENFGSVDIFTRGRTSSSSSFHQCYLASYTIVPASILQYPSRHRYLGSRFLLREFKKLSLFKAQPRILLHFIIRLTRLFHSNYSVIYSISYNIHLYGMQTSLAILQAILHRIMINLIAIICIFRLHYIS
jgi:hypothetical protein